MLDLIWCLLARCVREDEECLFVRTWLDAEEEKMASGWLADGDFPWPGYEARAGF